ncbi:MAG: bifunctional metallophosphatase/5'-nucleotidase, partial [Candidatus Aminicenantes bacterium]|nr:bifunctional metallophosphatase/5'-nucleotidase [Candidatus Aminicenantes bacterium]
HSALLPFGNPSFPGPFGWLAAAHGRAALVRESGGIARMATLIKKIRAMKKNVLALHAGDVFVGSFEFNKYLGYPELKIMENLYDAMSLGNHEFDLGLDALAGVISGQLAGGDPVALPLLNANISFSGLPLEAMIQKSIIRSVGGVKVGIFGVANEDAENYSAEVISRFSGDVYTVAGTQAGLLRAAGCEVVICLSHLGTMADLMGLADNVPGIDIIVGGHSHDLFEEAVVRGGKIIVQAGDYGRDLGELTVSIDPVGKVSLVDWYVHPVDSRIKPDPRLQGQLNVLRNGVVRDPRFGPVYSQIVALAGRTIEKDWPKTGPNRDGALGNLVTDAMRKALTDAGFQVDCALDAFGYTATSIQAGKVVGADVLRAVPYGYDPVSGLGFKLVLASLPGSLILGGLEYSTSFVDFTSALSIQPSGLTFAYDSSKPRSPGLGQFSRLDLNSVMIGGEYVAANPKKLYWVAMSEQVFNFLNSLVEEPLFKIDTGIFEYNAVRDYMKSLRFVVYKSEGRVKDTTPVAAVKSAIR